METKDSLLMTMIGNAIDVADYDESYMALTQLTNYETYLPVKRTNESTIRVRNVNCGNGRARSP
jgi:hypothetical protein